MVVKRGDQFSALQRRDVIDIRLDNKIEKIQEDPCQVKFRSSKGVSSAGGNTEITNIMHVKK